MDASASLPALRPLRDAADLDRLIGAAAADDHRVIAPTYVIEKAGEVAGYIALNSLPTVHGWFHTGKMRARDSLTIINCVENLVRAQRQTHLLWLLPHNATWLHHAEALGYVPIGHCALKLKQL